MREDRFDCGQQRHPQRTGTFGECSLLSDVLGLALGGLDSDRAVAEGGDVVRRGRMSSTLISRARSKQSMTTSLGTIGLSLKAHL